jgi:hypothetical protein
MESPMIWLVGAGIVAVGAGAALAAKYLFPNRIPKQEPISARRAKVLEAIAAVVPSQYGDSKFKKIAPGYDPADPALPTGFTTCGYLPCYVGSVLGAPKCITQGGLEQMRTNGRALGAWVDAGGTNRPKPGDLYAIGTDKLIVHVGVIIDPSGDVWKTADSGQGAMGSGQSALYVERSYDPTNVTLAQTKPVLGKPRKLAGWIDIDKVPGATP